jgi:hypothetical protein
MQGCVLHSESVTSAWYKGMHVCIVRSLLKLQVTNIYEFTKANLFFKSVAWIEQKSNTGEHATNLQHNFLWNPAPVRAYHIASSSIRGW